jgi:hypothetical protein
LYCASFLTLFTLFSIWSTGNLRGDPFAASTISATTSGGTARGANFHGLDFYEDPFKNSNYRYADPFEGGETGDDPFSPKTTSENDDPFASVPNATAAGLVADFDSAFGGDPFGAADPFSAAQTFNGGSSRTAAAVVGDPFSPPPSSTAVPADPFGGGFGGAKFDTSAAVDPFGSSFSGSVFSASHNNNNKLDSSFGVNSNAAFSNDPFR